MKFVELLKGKNDEHLTQAVNGYSYDTESANSFFRPPRHCGCGMGESGCAVCGICRSCHYDRVFSGYEAPDSNDPSSVAMSRSHSVESNNQNGGANAANQFLARRLACKGGSRWFSVCTMPVKESAMIEAYADAV
jgi:hypothetical protein